MDKKGKTMRILLAATVLMLMFTTTLPVAVDANDGTGASAQSAKWGSATAIVKDGVEPTRYGSGDEAESRWPSPFPKRPELYVPMPIPEPTEVIVTEPESRLISYNMITGEETISEITYGDFSMSALVEGGVAGGVESLGGIEEEQAQPRTFTDLSLVSNPEDYPWRVNCKLYMTFPGVGNYVASGVLIDPLHVLTAGHCVYYEDTWASSITVVPGYENGARPYGDASAVGLLSWTGWVDNGNWDHDMGVIALDRPIGALTGWHGYGYNDDPSFYTGNAFHNPGYPAAYPYNGQYMYYWYGEFEYTESVGGNWYGNEVGIKKYAYGGQSGSGAYYVHPTLGRIVYAELSNGTPFPFPPETNFPRITSTKFGHIGDFIVGDTPSTFDLIPLDVNTSPGTINPGQQLSSLNYVVHNYSSASWSGTVDVDVYLSTDDNISTVDTLIQSHSFAHSFGSKSTAMVNVPTPPTIPGATSDGDYFIGVILDISDYSTANNDSDGQDASPIHVSSGPAPWTYIFEDPMRQTELRVNTAQETFRFLAPDGYDSGVVHATEMTVSGGLLSGKGYTLGPLAGFQFWALPSQDFCVGLALVWPTEPPWFKLYWIYDPAGSTSISPTSPTIEEYLDSGCLPGSLMDVLGDQCPWCGEDKIETSVGSRRN